MKYVLDTNIVARLLDGDERVLRHLVDVEPRGIGIPLLVFAELLFGAEKSKRAEQNRARVHALAEQLRMLDVGVATVRRYAVVRAELERRGRPKSDFDLIIACRTPRLATRNAPAPTRAAVTRIAGSDPPVTLVRARVTISPPSFQHSREQDPCQLYW